jgi:hypothetical protein
VGRKAEAEGQEGFDGMKRQLMVKTKTTEQLRATEATTTNDKTINHVLIFFLRSTLGEPLDFPCFIFVDSIDTSFYDWWFIHSLLTTLQLFNATEI